MLRRYQLEVTLFLQALIFCWLFWLTFLRIENDRTFPTRSFERAQFWDRSFSRQQNSTRTSLPKTSEVHGPDVKVDPRIRSNIIGLAIKRTESDWLVDEQICDSKQEFLKVNLKTPNGDTPIYVHDLSIDGISRSLQKTGKWEPDLEGPLHRCFQNRGKETVFLDIGANIGVFSLSLAKAGRRVISVEPMKDNAARLCRSMKEGGFSDRFTFVYNPVSDKRQWMELVADPQSKGGTYVRDPLNPATTGVYSIHLDDLLEVFDIKSAVIKIDVERHEARALGRASKFFEKVDVPCMMMEWERHHRSPDGYRLMMEMAEFGMLAYDPNNFARSLDADKFGTWPRNVVWRRVRDYGPNTQ